uniref:Ribonuclease H-like domain-containing protein n=1 Tax=Tanacetum cinerariifolium TaxID=118510 RepID=A0A699HCG8_TANCI|nr:ribonuclease H-like domain-containing protein [Tanacetum cinerariifolium]
MYKAFPLPVMEFPLLGEVPTASEESSHCQKKREATAVKIALLLKSRRNCQSKSDDNYTNYRVPTSSEESSHCQKKRKATAVKIALLLKSRRNCQSKSDDNYTKLVPHVTPFTLTAKDMQKRKNNVKVRTTLLLSLPDEHQLRFSKYKTAQELWAAILKTFDGNEATKKTEKNLLKQQYGNFKAEDSETLEQTFNRLQRKSELNPQNIAFISSAKHSRGNEDVNTASVSTASINVPTASANIRIDEDDMEEMDIKWNMALLSMSADKFWKKTGKKISIQGTTWQGLISRRLNASTAIRWAPKALMAIDGVGWDWSYMVNDEKNHALVADEEAPTEFAFMANINAESKVFDNSLYPKDCKKNTNSLNSKVTDLTDKLFDAKNMIYHYKLRLAQVESRLVEHKDREIKYCEKIRGLEFKTESSDEYIEILKKELDLIKKEKEGLDNKMTGFQTALKDLDSLLESQRLDKNKEGLGYSDVPPPPAQIYSSPKKDLSWTGLLSSKMIPTISPKSFIKFVKANDSPTNSKTDKAETAKKPPVKYAEQYRKPTKKPKKKGEKMDI